MTSRQIPLSKRPLQQQVVLGGLTVLLACTLVSLFFDRLVTGAPNLQAILLTTLWITLPGLWLFGSVIALKTWPKTTYTLTENALQIRKKGWFGHSQEDLYRYDAIMSTRTISKAGGAYGAIEVTLAEQSEKIVLKNVTHPEKYAAELKKVAVSI